MVSTVKTRPTHYEVLGLTPEASSEEIAQAFARELRGPRPFGSLAGITVAFETLRDPARRAAYDASLAPKPEPEPLKPMLRAPADWAPFVARPEVTELPRIPSPPRRPVPAEPHPLLDRLDSRRAAAPAAVMREPLRPQPREPEPAAHAAPAPQPEPQPSGDDPIEQERRDAHRALHFFEEEGTQDGFTGSNRWKLPVIAGIGLTLAIGIGAWTGVNAGGEDQADQPKRFATLKIASAKPAPAPAPEPDVDASEEVVPASASRRKTAPAEPRAATDRLLEAAVAKQAEIKASLAADGILEAEPPAVETASAKLPLPNAVIARTIGRIGYPCGSVASASPLGGGAYKVTCTSGHSYRAAPVKGRYRFRRLG